MVVAGSAVPSSAPSPAAPKRHLTLLGVTIVAAFLLFTLNGPAFAQTDMPPARPATPIVDERSYNFVTLEWTDPGDDTITGYQISRRNDDTDPENAYTLIEFDTGTADTTYTDRTVDSETTYVYRIAAINAAGIGNSSATVRVTTPETPFDLVLSTGMLTVDLGNTDRASYTVKLLREPKESVTVTISGHEGAGVELDSTSVTFTTTDWGMEQTVTVTITAGTEDVALTLIHTAKGGAFDDAMADLDLMAQDFEVFLRSLTVSPRNIIGFNSDRKGYAVGVVSTVTQATIVATPRESTSTVTFDNADDDIEAGHQVDLVSGLNTVIITVTDDQGSSSDYSVKIGRGVTDALGWKAVDDLDGLRSVENYVPFGVWGNGTTLWVSDLRDTRVYAYNRDGTPDASKNITLHSSGQNVFTSSNTDPTGIWSDGEIMWVADSDDNKLYAYRLSDGRRVGSREITLDAGNSSPTGIWSDGETMWVSGLTSTQLYAYRLSDGARMRLRDFETGIAHIGHWSDGVTWWVSGVLTKRVIAIDRDNGMRDTGKDFVPIGAAGRATSNGIWSDGETMWVAPSGAKVYSYNMPVSGNADLRTLAVDGVEVSGFDFDTATYVVDVGGAVRQVTISAEARQLKARITSITPADADVGLDGHQVDINRAETPVVMTVTAQDGTTKSYTVTVRAPAVVLSEASLTVQEGGTDAESYSVWLSRMPPSPVTVTITGHAGTDLLLDKTSLTFTTINWNIPQTVRVTAAEDQDSMDDAATLRHAAGGGGYILTDLPVKVEDNDKGAVLRTLTVGPRDIIGFTPDRRDYAVGMASTVTRATIVAIPHSSSSIVTFNGDDADDNVGGHQVDLVPGVNTVTVTVTSTDVNNSGDNSRDYTLTIGRGVTDAFGWKAVDDLDGPRAVGNDNPFGVWGNGTTLWVSDLNDLRVYAYNKDGTPDASQEIALHSENDAPTGIWSDGEIMWVANSGDAKLYAYRLSDGGRVGSRNITVDDETGPPTHIWSDGETIWVTSLFNDEIHAYRLSDGARMRLRDFDTGVFFYGHWTDGVTWWVANVLERVVAVDRDSGMRDLGKDFAAIEATNIFGTWSDGETMWVVDQNNRKVYSYNMPVSSNADLRTLALDGAEVSDFDFDVTSYDVDVGPAVRQITVSAEARQLKARITSITPADADVDLAGHQVDINKAETPVVVTVTAQDGTTKSYTVTVQAPAVVLSEESLEVQEGATEAVSYTVQLSRQPTETVTVTVSGQAGTDLRLEGLSFFRTLTFTTTDWNEPRTVSVTAVEDADEADDIVTLLHVATGAQFEGASADLAVTIDDLMDAEIVLSEESLTVEEGARDGVSYTVRLSIQPTGTVTVTVSGHEGTGLKLGGLSPTDTLTFNTLNWNIPQSVTLTSSEDDDAADAIVTLSHVATGTGLEGSSTDLAVTIDDDETARIVLSPTFFIEDEGATGLTYTVRLSHVPTTPVTVAIRVLGGPDLTVTSPTTLTFDTDDWNIPRQVSFSIQQDDDFDDEFRALGHTATGGQYSRLSAAVSVSIRDNDGLAVLLRSLSVSPKDIVSFTQERNRYAVGMASTVTQATVIAVPLLSTSSVTFNAIDTDDNAEGHQVNLAPGLNTVVITVTSGSEATYSYTIAIGRGVTDAYGWKAVDDLDGLRSFIRGDLFGVWGNDTTLYVGRRSPAYVYAFTRGGTRQTTKDIRLRNPDSAGIWSDGETMWVADRRDAKLYAYRLSDGMRVDSKDITLDVENDIPTGVWSDGETIWVADRRDAKLYAYRLSDGMRQHPGDLDVSSLSNSPQGHWSDGVTWWVAGSGGVFALDRVTGEMDSAKHLATKAAGNETPHGVWSDGETMWVVDQTNKKVYSYNIPLSGNADLRTLAVDGVEVSGFDFDTTRYALEVGEGVRQVTISAEALHLQARITSITPADADVDLDGHQVDIDSAETTVVVTVTAPDGTTKRYNVTSQSPTLVLSVDTLAVAAGYTDGSSYTVRLPFQPSSPVTVTISGHAGTDLLLDKTTLTFTTENWNIPQTVTVTAADDEDSMDDAATLTHTASGGGFDSATADLLVIVKDAELQLLSLSVSPENIIGFSPERNRYAAGMGSTVTRATIIATPLISTSTVTFDGDDADDIAAGHQVDLASGVNTVNITVTSQDDSSTGIYVIFIGRGVTDAFGWKAVDDLDGLRAAGNLDPFGLWGNGTTLWVSDLDDLRVYAYNRDGTRDVSKEIALHFENEFAAGIWSDGETMWVADLHIAKLYAYRLSDGTRDDSKDITLDAENDIATGVWSDGETIWVADSRDAKFYAYRLSDGMREFSKDFEVGATLGGHLGQWSDGAIWWATSISIGNVLATDRDGGAEDSNNHFTTLSMAGNRGPGAVWSDGETMWVTDYYTFKVYSYNMPLSGNADLRTLAVDGAEVSGFDFDTTTYVVNSGVAVRQVTISTEARQLKARITSITPDDADVDLDDHQVEIDKTETPAVVTVTAQDGTTKSYTVTVRAPTVVLSQESLTVHEGARGAVSYTVKLSTRPSSPVTVTITGHAGTDLNLTGLSSNDTLTFTAGNWNIPQSVLVAAEEDADEADENVTLTHAASGGGFDGSSNDLSVRVEDDAKVRLDTLTVSPRDIIGFTPGRTGYAVGMASTVTRATITATPLISSSTVTFDGDDVDDNTGGHQVDLAPGVNTVTITVTDDQVSTSRDYTLTIGRGVTDAFEWKAVDDLDGLRAVGNNNSFGVWGNGTTLWVSDLNDLRVYAYNRDGTRDASKDIALHSENHVPAGIWSDDETMWVANSGDDRLYAYRLSDGGRAIFREITLDAGNSSPTDIWSDSETMWVSSLNSTQLYAYRLSDGMREFSKDLDVSSLSTSPQGHWSDGVTWWVAGSRGVFALDRDTGLMDNTKPLATRAAGNETPHGVWSDGETMWVVDQTNKKVYSYNMPVSGNADLRTLAAYGAEVSGFDFDTATYVVDVGGAVRQVTISAKARQLKARITSITPADADVNLDGHQVDINEAETPVVVTVTAQDGTTKSYTVTVRAPAVVLSKASLTVQEGGTDAESYAVWLSRMPPSPVTVTITGHAGTDLLLDKTSLTFTTTNWNIPQTVGVTAAEDEDSMDDAATLRHAAGGGGYILTDLPVMVEDNDKRVVLRTLTVSPRDIIGFTPDRRDYAVGMASTVTRATITATPQNSSSIVTFNGDDADDNAGGHQVDLVPGVSTVTVTVTSEDGIYSKDYTLTIGRGVTDAFGWKAVDDLDGLRAAGNNNPFGVWGDGTTLWVSDLNDLRVYAYNKDGTRDASKDIALHSDNNIATGPSDQMSVGKSFSATRVMFREPTRPPSDSR